MKTVEDHLREAASEVHGQVRRVPDRHANSLRVRANNRRLAAITASLVVAVGLVMVPLTLLSNDAGRSGLDASGTSSQGVAQSDGDITFEQYENAYIGYVECLRDAGYTVEGPLLFGRDPNAGLGLGLGGDRGLDPTIHLQRLVIGDVDRSQLDATDLACQESHLGDIEQRWIDQESAKLIGMDEWVDNLLKCAENSGMQIPESLSHEEMFNDVGTDPSDQIFLDLAVDAIVSHGCRPWEG